MNEPFDRGFEFQDVGDVTIVRLTGDDSLFDDRRVQEFGKALFDLIDRQGRRNLVLDFQRVIQINDAVLGKLIVLDKKLRAIGGSIAFFNVGREARSFLESIQFTKLFKIHWQGDDDELDASGVPSRLIPPRPSNNQSAALKPPDSASP